MHIDVSTLALQTVNLLVLVWLLARYLFRPVAEIVAARQREASRSLEAARLARVQADAEKVKAAEEAARNVAERQRILQQASAEAEAEKARALEQARADAERLRASARAEWENERRHESAELAERAGRLAVDISTRLAGRLPEEALISGFIDGLAEGFARLPPEVRSEAVLHGPVVVNAPRALSESERRALDSVLARAFGAPVAVDLRVDPQVIAGLEIALPHASVTNSLRADLQKIARELVRHDEAEGG